MGFGIVSRFKMIFTGPLKFGSGGRGWLSLLASDPVALKQLYMHWCTLLGVNDMIYNMITLGKTENSQE